VLASFGLDIREVETELRGLPLRWKRTVSDAALLAASFALPLVAGTVIREEWRRRDSGPVAKVD